MSHEFNFHPLNHPQDDINFVFQPNEKDGPFIAFEPHWTMAHVMHAAGIFPSSSQARKNGWDAPIPEGFNTFTVTKKKIKIFIWNPIETS